MDTPRATTATDYYARQRYERERREAFERRQAWLERQRREAWEREHRHYDRGYRR